MRIDELEIETAAVGVLAVDQRNLGCGAEEIALDQPEPPRVVAAHAREARLWLRAPAVGGDGPQREFAARPRTDRIDTHRAKHAERAQIPFALLHARGIERIAAIQEQPPPDHRLA